nr:secoisolariciresinol dehydrogenase-like [Tanacetum cinerariifolium]
MRKDLRIANETSSILQCFGHTLEGNVALIIEAVSGIGEHTAKLFAKHGARIVIADLQDQLDNDVEFGANGGTTNIENNEAASSESSFMNVDNSSSGTNPIIEKIKKFEDLHTSWQAILVDKAGNPLKKVECLGEYDIEDEVASVDNDMARFIAYGRIGFGTQSLLEQ